MREFASINFRRRMPSWWSFVRCILGFATELRTTPLEPIHRLKLPLRPSSQTHLSNFGKLPPISTLCLPCKYPDPLWSFCKLDSLSSSKLSDQVKCSSAASRRNDRSVQQHSQPLHVYFLFRFHFPAYFKASTCVYLQCNFIFGGSITMIDWIVALSQLHFRWICERTDSKYLEYGIQTCNYLSMFGFQFGKPLAKVVLEYEYVRTHSQGCCFSNAPPFLRFKMLSGCWILPDNHICACCDSSCDFLILRCSLLFWLWNVSINFCEFLGYFVSGCV